MLQSTKQEGMEFLLFMDNVAQSNPDDLYNVNAIRRWKLDKFESKPARMSEPIESVITCVKADKGAPSGMVFRYSKRITRY